MTEWKKWYENSCFWNFIFWKRTTTVNLKKFSSNTIFWEILHSYIQLFQWKRSFEIFLIDHYAGDIENKNK